MKRCPKCNRTYPDESQKFCTVDGGLLISESPAFDPNVTIRATAADVGMHSGELPPEKATSRELIDPNATIAASSMAPTIALPRDTGPTVGVTTFGGEKEPPVQPQVRQAPPPSAPLPQPKKKSALPWILGALALVLLLGGGAALGLFFFVIKPRLANLDQQQARTVEPKPQTSTTTTTTNPTTAQAPATSEASPEVVAFAPPPGAIKFENSKERLDGKLAEHYFDFSFYYPESWKVDPKAGIPGATNFAKVERMLPPDFTQENFAVGWYTSRGTFATDEPAFPQLVELLSAQLSKNFPEYRKVSEGPTKINSMDAYEFRFVSESKGTEKGDLQLWGRVVFLPSGVEGQTTGATLIMLSTSLAPELSGVEDVGVKGEMPLILDSFRFGKS